MMRRSTLMWCPCGVHVEVSEVVEVRKVCWSRISNLRKMADRGKKQKTDAGAGSSKGGNPPLKVKDPEVRSASPDPFMHQNTPHLFRLHASEHISCMAMQVVLAKVKALSEKLRQQKEDDRCV